VRVSHRFKSIRKNHGLSDPETIASLTPSTIAAIRHGKSAAA
jgi:transcriptional regulator with XRE-family HTH domain